MYRRDLLGTSFAVVSLPFVAGCGRMRGQESWSPPPTPDPNLGSGVDDATFRILDSAAGPDQDEAVTAEFRENSKTIVLSGTIKPYGCYHPHLTAAERSEGVLTTIIGTHWAESQPPSELDCGATIFQYELELVLDSALPETVRVEYDYGYEQYETKTFSVQRNTSG